jgi:hypothetical protein
LLSKVGSRNIPLRPAPGHVRAIGTTPGVFTQPECEAFVREHALTVTRV